MKTLPNTTKRVKSLDTLAQLVTTPPETSQESDFSVVSQSLTDQSTLLKRARAKYLSNAIVFRLADVESPLNKSYWNTYHCASKLIKEGDKITGQYCKNRWCMVCNRIRTAQLIHTYQDTINSWENKHFLTLTVPNVKAHELPLTISVMNNGLRQILNTLKMRSYRKVQLFPKIKGFRKLECTFNPERVDYHPHFHLIVDSEYAAIEIKEQWLKKFPACSDLAQHISKADDKTSIELFKYFTKILTKTKTPDGKKYEILPQVLDTIFRSIKGVRTFQNFGFKLEKNDDEIMDTAEIEKDEKIKSFLDETVYGWLQEFSDWVDVKTGECLTGYTPSTKMQNLTEENV